MAQGIYGQRCFNFLSKTLCRHLDRGSWGYFRQCEIRIILL